MEKKIVCVLLTAIMVLQTAGCADIRTTVLDKISEETSLFLLRAEIRQNIERKEVAKIHQKKTHHKRLQIRQISDIRMIIMNM